MSARIARGEDLTDRRDSLIDPYPVESLRKSYLVAAGLALAAVPISFAIRTWVGPIPSLPFFIVLVLVARMGYMGPTVLVALLSSLFLDYVFFPPALTLRVPEFVALSAAMLIVAVIVKRTVDSLRTAEHRRAQLEGVQLAAREVADRLGNSLALASATIELLDEIPDLPPAHRRLLVNCRARLREAGDDLRKLQRVSHVEIRETTAGPMLDLDRSASWPPPAQVEQPARLVGEEASSRRP